MDRELLAVDDDGLLGVGRIEQRSAVRDLDVVALAVDGRVGLGLLAAEAQHEIAEGHDQGTEFDRSFRAQELVGEKASDQRS